MLELLGNLGDFIGGIAVVATLIYLAVQVRQNTAALKTASRQEVVAGMREHNRLAFQPGAGAWNRAAERFPDVPEDDRRYFSATMADLLLFFQGAHALHEAGTLEDETYEAYLDFVAAALATPGGRWFWHKSRRVFTSRMATALDARLERGDLPDLLQLFSVEPESAA